MAGINSYNMIRQAWPKTRSRGRRVKNPGESKVRIILAARSGGLCERCGRPGQSLHHRKNRSQGGPWSASNCVWVCGDGVRGCHGWIGQHPLAAKDEGFAVPRNGDPAQVPIQSRLHGRVRLADDGSVSPAPIEGGAA